ARDLVRPRIPVGSPNPNTVISIVDEQMRPLPAGIFGQVYIGGIGIARGYLGEPELTAASFRHNPLAVDNHQGVFYRTGDIGRWLSDGTIDLCGRRDSQIKLRGNRVELAEIETCLNRHPLVNQSAVAVWKDPRDLERLVAYVVLAEGSHINATDLRDHA